MAEVTATEAARSFADLLDAVEHRGEAVKELLRRHAPDRGWMRDVAAVRSLVDLQERA